MDTRQILQLFQKIQRSLENLKEVAEKKQKALVDKNFEDLESAIKSEEEAVVLVKRLEQMRLNEMRKIKTNLNIVGSKQKFSEVLVEYYPETEKKLVQVANILEGNIKQLVEEVSTLNNHNIFLIKHSSEFIDRLIKTLLGGKDKHILDRRV